MDLIGKFFSDDFYINWIELLTIAAVVVVLLYFFYSLNLFKKG